MNTQTVEKMTLTPDEAARQLGISKPTMYTLCGRKDFPTVKIGRKIIIPFTSLEKWLEDQANAGRDA